ncbi:Ig-like V-type domain-containing protein FAM187A [Apostichopus japonicus]|uniref:Ig-like V-type domain-containing protein FAM187A n=1 Tax=Stichopus japonicus TaxID=307972 RepID=UPI003AB3ED5A
MLCSNHFTSQALFLILMCSLRPYTVANEISSPDVSSENSTKKPAQMMNRRRWRRYVMNVAKHLYLGLSADLDECDDQLIQSVVAYQGESLLLRCTPCSADFDTSSVWKVQLQGTEEEVSLRALQLPEVVREGRADCAITELSPAITGKYRCVSGRTRGTYEITVNTLPDFSVVFTDESPANGHSNGVTTKWGRFTKCSASHCGDQGEQVKIGVCYQSVDVEQYQTWVPCRSIVAITSSNPSQQRDKKMIQKCTTECPVADGGPNVVSMHAEMPALPALVTQEALFPAVGETIALSCSSIAVVTYARWEKDNVMIHQIELHQAENPHISIDSFHTITIHGVLESDAGEYTCWHKDVQHLNYKITVTPRAMNTEKAEGGSKKTGIALAVLVIIVIIITVLKLRKCGKCY